MQKKHYVLLAISIVTAIIGLRYIVFLNTRHHLLCEVLKPGMSEGEVVAILMQTGDFTMSRGEWGGGYVELGINFTDTKGSILFGDFVLSFSDYKYDRAYKQIGFERTSTITFCSFSQAIEPVSRTPNP
jgi:hypothetical protein